MLQTFSCIWADVHEGERSTSRVLLSYSAPYIVSHGILLRGTLTNWVASKLQGFSFLCVLSTGASDACHSTLPLHRCWVLNSDIHAFKAR